MRKILLAGCVLVAGLATARAETLKVASPQKGSWENSAPEWGQRLGYFQQQGLEIELIYTNGGSESQQAVISGSMDMAIGAGILGILGAQSKGAPVTVLSNSYVGTGDSYWYVRTDSPVQSLADASGRTVAFSVPGSSTNLTLLALLKHAGMTGARPTPTGNPVTTLTQVMSGQIDIGYAVTPFLANELDRHEVRLVARGADADEMRDQSVRVAFVNKAVLAARRDAVQRFMVGLRKTLEWMYSDDPRVMQWYAEGAGITPDQARRSRDQFDPQRAVMPGPPQNLALSAQQALDYKYVRAPLTAEQLAGFVDVMDGK
jgi:NitT/TauT family transport system substrate-binding protein